jgi:hypothetical protein
MASSPPTPAGHEVLTAGAGALLFIDSAMTLYRGFAEDG